MPSPRQISIDIELPGLLLESRDSTWQVGWDGGVPPYEVRFDFGGGASETDPSGVVATFGRELQVQATMIEQPGPIHPFHKLEVEVRDSVGNIGCANVTYRTRPARTRMVASEDVQQGAAPAVVDFSHFHCSNSGADKYPWGTLMADEHGNLNVSGVDNSVLVE